MTYTARWTPPGGDYEDVKKVRTAVFVDEQGFSDEFDKIDATAWHLVFYDEHRHPFACGRIFADPAEGRSYHIGRVAILKERRGGGIGLFLMRELEDKAIELGGHKTVLSAQIQAQPFYEKAGYVPRGETYMDQHCPHIHMEKALGGPN